MITVRELLLVVLSVVLLFPILRYFLFYTLTLSMEAPDLFAFERVFICGPGLLLCSLILYNISRFILVRMFAVIIGIVSVALILSILRAVVNEAG